MNRVKHLVQETRPVRLVDLIERRHINAAKSRQWELRMQGALFMLVLFVIGYLVWM